MPTVDEKNAAFRAAMPKLQDWVRQLVPNHDYPFVGNPQTMFMARLTSAQGRELLLNEISAVLEAAEKVRARAKL